MREIDHTGKKYNKLIGIRKVGYKQYKHRKSAIWLWQCDCGNITKTKAERVTKGTTKSCGCLRGAYTGVMSLAYSIYCDAYRNIKAGDTITFEEFYKLSSQPCDYCGTTLYSTRKSRNDAVQKLEWKYNGLDRVNNNLPHTLENCVPCCWKCNNDKGRSTREEFIEITNRRYEWRQLQDKLAIEKQKHLENINNNRG
jgi:hypothetical protein